MTNVTARAVHGLERVAATVSKAGSDLPTGLLLEGGGTGRRYNLGIDRSS